MQLLSHNPANIAKAIGGYSQAIEIKNAGRLLFISGQIAELPSGEVPDAFEAQCELIWKNIKELLAAGGMDFSNLIKINTYLTHPDQATVNSSIRNKYLGDHRPALTVVVVQTLSKKWLLEIDAIATSD